jgi:hypothetical protein
LVTKKKKLGRLVLERKSITKDFQRENIKDFCKINVGAFSQYIHAVYGLCYEIVVGHLSLRRNKLKEIYL